MSELTPLEIVNELSRHIVGHLPAKKAVAVALRNRYRRQKVSEEMFDAIVPKNILMVGPTGVGKTEIARRLAKLTNSPFIKLEATKFTEIGYVGRDVESIIRDLLDVAIQNVKTQHYQKFLVIAEANAEKRLVEALVGKESSHETKTKFRDHLKMNHLNDKEIEIELQDNSSTIPTLDIPGMSGASLGMVNLTDLLGKALGPEKMVKKKLKISEAKKILLNEECEKLIDMEIVKLEAIDLVQNNGIVFIDEIDKLCNSNTSGRGEVSREGVQRDLLPLIEGTNVVTKHGNIKTDHILFITSGSFHLAKPSELLPELQGRLPIRVKLDALTKQDLVNILVEPETNLIKQYIALMAAENIKLSFTDDAIDEIAEISSKINQEVENIGARRLHTIMEKLLEDLSFNASDLADGTEVIVDKQYVIEHLSTIAMHTDLSKFIL